MQAFEYGKLFEPANGLRAVERKAQRCLAYCRHKLNLDDIPLPVPVDKWIETALDIGFGVSNLSHLGPDVLGAAFIREREILVSESVLSSAGRFRFTCAHELGHFLLHSKLCDVFKDTKEAGTDGGERIERHADRFAAAFLMPIPPLERELVGCLANARLDPTAALSTLMVATEELGRLWNTLVMPFLCRRFGVSRVATVIRCRGLVLVSDPRRCLLPARFFHDFMTRRQQYAILGALRRRGFASSTAEQDDEE